MAPDILCEAWNRLIFTLIVTLRGHFACAHKCQARGRPLMIWGGGRGKIENEFIFSAAMPFEIYFFPEKASWNFFPEEGLLKFIFSRTRTFKKKFFLISSGRPLTLNSVPIMIDHDWQNTVLLCISGTLNIMFDVVRFIVLYQLVNNSIIRAKPGLQFYLRMVLTHSRNGKCQTRQVLRMYLSESFCNMLGVYRLLFVELTILISKRFYEEKLSLKAAFM